MLAILAACSGSNTTGPSDIPDAAKAAPTQTQSSTVAPVAPADPTEASKWSFHVEETFVRVGRLSGGPASGRVRWNGPGEANYQNNAFNSALTYFNEGDVKVFATPDGLCPGSYQVDFQSGGVDVKYRFFTYTSTIAGGACAPTPTPFPCVPGVGGNCPNPQPTPTPEPSPTPPGCIAGEPCPCTTGGVDCPEPKPSPTPPTFEQYCYYNVPGSDGKEQCMAQPGYVSWNELNHLCALDYPGIALKGFNLNPGQSAEGCLSKHDPS